MTGWRIGYCGGPKEIVTAMGTIQGQSTSNASSISQKAALAALNGDQQCVADMNRAFKERHDYRGRRAQQPAWCVLPAGRRNVLRLRRRARRHAQPRACATTTPSAEYLLNKALAWPWWPAPASAPRGTCACPSPAAGKCSKRPSSACALCCPLKRRPRLKAG